MLNGNILEIFGKVTWEYKIDGLIDKLFNLLNGFINGNYLKPARTNNLSNELLETLKILENCTIGKDNIKKINLDALYGTINEIENLILVESGKGGITNRLNDELFDINVELIGKLCKDCDGKKSKSLTDKCGNEEMSKLLYNSYSLEWIPFDEFGNVEYLAKGGFGEVHKATWINSYEHTDGMYKGEEVVLKRIFNSNNIIIDILKEVKKKFNVDINVNLLP